MLPFKLRLADVLILFDRSGSMNTAFGQGTRYSVETEILNSLLPVYDDKIRFGYQQFPGQRSCAAGRVPSCCADRPSVEVGFNNGPAINLAMQDAAPVEGNTPTAEALRYAREYFLGLEDGVRDRYVLLSTDGRPSCTLAGRLGDNEAISCAEALGEVGALAAQGVKVIVLGIGPGLATDPGGQPSCLDDIAQRGGAPAADQSPAFYTGEDGDLLETALQRIFGAVTRPSCQLELRASPANPAEVAVFLDTKEIPKDRDNGWDYQVPGDFKRLQVFGESCRRLEKFQAMTIEVRFGCAPCRARVNCE